MRRASNVSEAVDMLDTLSSSDSESDSESGSLAFHDASETLPDGEPSQSSLWLEVFQGWHDTPFCVVVK